MNKLRFLTRELWKGRSVSRSFLDLRLREEILKGKTIDVGGGKNPNYISFVKREDNVEFLSFDVKAGSTDINFETDQLPAADGTYDTVLCLNVMEHIYHFDHFARELVRITKPQTGRLIGFVPFLMWYHPDRQDYFRYTHEALEKIFTAAGAKKIKIEAIGQGPFIAAAQMVLSTVPKFLRVPVFFFFWGLDKCYRLLKGKNSRAYQLGYYFVVTT